MISTGNKKYISLNSRGQCNYFKRQVKWLEFWITHRNATHSSQKRLMVIAFSQETVPSCRAQPSRAFCLTRGPAASEFPWSDSSPEPLLVKIGAGGSRGTCHPTGVPYTCQVSSNLHLFLDVLHQREPECMLGKETPASPIPSPTQSVAVWPRDAYFNRPPCWGVACSLKSPV